MNPKAVINPISTTVCSGYPFEVSPANLTNGIVPAGTVYTWSAPQVISSLLVTGGTGASLAQSISGTLHNATNVMQTAVYTVIPTSQNCGANDPFTLTVFVNPTPEITMMSTTVCSGFSHALTVIAAGHLSRGGPHRRGGAGGGNGPPGMTPLN